MSKQSQSNPFGGLGGTIENSLATENGHFQKIREINKKGFNHQKQVASNIGKRKFGGLGEAQNISLATEKGPFR